jgi:hypothetical protein
VPNLVPRPHVANAITLTTTAGQIATIAGPVLGGLLYGVTAPLAYSTSLGLLLIGIVFVTLIARPSQDVVTGRNELGNRKRRLPLHLAREDHPRRDLA